MQPTTRKMELEARPLSRSSSLKAVKADPNQNKTQRIFRLSFTNFKLKKQVETDILSGVLQINTRDKNDKDVQPQVHLEPNIIRMDKFFNPNRKELRRFTMINNLQPVRAARIHTGEINPQYELGSDTQQKPNRKFAHKRPITQSSQQRSVGRLPSADNIRAVSRAGNGREFYQPIQQALTNIKSSDKPTTIHNDEKIMTNSDFYVDLPGLNLEGFDSPQVSKETNVKNQSKRNSVSDSVTKGTRANYSTSVSSHNTHQDINCGSGHIEDDRKMLNNYQHQRQARDEFIREDSLASRQFKTIERIQGAKYQAQQINDQVVRQSQFLQNDEEEEVNFKELCDALNSHW